MSIQRYRTDNPRSASEVADAIEQELQQINSSAPVIEGTQNYAFVNSLATTLAEQQEQSLSELYDATYVTDAGGPELTKLARGLGVIRQDPVAATGVVEFSRDSPANESRTAPSGTIVSTGGDDAISFETTELATISGPTTNTDETEYTTTDTSFVTKTTFTVDVTDRESVDVSAQIKNSDGSYTTHLDVVDVTNGTTIVSYSTQATSYASRGPDTYDVSSLTGEIDIEFQLRTTNAAGTAFVDTAELEIGGETAAKANVECTETGPVGNIGQDTITVIVDSPAGIQSVTNPNSTGDPSYTLTNGTTPLTTGDDEETDESLRARVLDTTAIGGAGTAEAVELAIENIDDVISADVFTNRTNSTVDGVDPWHTEVRIYGGGLNEIANRLYEVMALGTIKTLQGGANGTLETVTLDISDLYGDLDIEISRPAEVSLDIEIDVVHDERYAGELDVKDAIVEYVGGTTTDARNIAGLGQAQNVLINEVENVTEDITGVDYANVTLVDDNSDGSDDSTTDSDGVPIYDINIGEVAIVNADNIIVNETQR